ncbi:hypothetical protein B0H17DRAFT_1039723 [Mycena rosella]|uniref:F-box domain-containing protein n=1 Tax=Mycena rosella TaxID=1033263 RepID=A0AAD7GSU4_MYCRO|nr:hypothetical protein B0H17DRAFT_1039723 [Mycena rosella]
MSVQNYSSAPPQNEHQWRDRQRACLAETRAKIRDCKTLLETLDAEREHLEDLLDTFTYPVITTPVEIISLIFLQCLPANGRVQPSKRGAPLLLAQICQHWRDIALSIPQLWSSVDFTFIANSYGPRRDWILRVSQNYDGASALLRAWFQRTQGLPLSITLRCAEERDGMPPGILPAIAEFSHQWGRLEIRLPLHDLPALDRIRGPFPLLNTLAIELSGMDGAVDDVPRLTAYRDAPQLREVRLLNGMITAWADLPATLTSLEVERRIGIFEWTSIFKRFPCLLHLSTASNVYQRSPGPEIMAPAPLKSLIVRHGDMLPLLTLPHLLRLKCRPAGFLPFLSRSLCELKHLTLVINQSTDERSLLDCLRSVPSLEQLDIHRQRNSHSFYEHLHSSELLPNLRDLSVLDPGYYYRYQPVIDMLRARRDPHPERAQLRSFELALNVRGNDWADDTSSPSGADALQLQRLAAGGLQFRVHTQINNWPAGFDVGDERGFPLKTYTVPYPN